MKLLPIVDGVYVMNTIDDLLVAITTGSKTITRERALHFKQTLLRTHEAVEIHQRVSCEADAVLNTEELSQDWWPLKWKVCRTRRTKDCLMPSS